MYYKLLQLNDQWKRKKSDSTLWQNPPTPTEKSNKQREQHKTPPKTIADRLKTVSRGNDSHPTGVVKPVTGSQPSH